MKLTSLLQFVDKLQQVGKINNLQQVCGVFGCVLTLCINRDPDRVSQETGIYALLSLNCK